MKNKKRSVMNNIKFLIYHGWKWDKKVFWYFGLYTIFTSIVPFIAIFQPKFLIDELMGEKRQEVLVLILAGFFIASALVNYLVAYLNGAYYPRMVKIRFGFISMLQEKTMTMDFKYTEDPKTLNDIESAFRAVNNNQDGIEGILHKLFSLLGSGIAFLGYVTIVAVLSPWVLTYLVFNVAVTYLLTLKVKKYEYSRKDEVSEMERKAHYIYKTMYDFSYGKDIRIYNLRNFMAEKFKVFKKDRVKIFKEVKYKYFSVSALDVILLLFREGIIYGYLIYRVIYKGMTIGDFTMYFATISGFAAWMQKIIEDIAHINAQILYINDFRDFLEIGEKQEKDKTEAIPKADGYEIEFRNVSFKYPNSERYVYKNLSLKINSGQRLAIVGINGAGKTTFVKLLTRLYEPDEGEILLNGTNIKNFDIKEYWKLFSVVFQGIKMLAFSIEENVTFEKPEDADRSKVMKALEKADMLNKINSLEKGIDTSLLKVLDKEGIELSGGENQRLALARALYKDGAIVVLDEPTAALDAIAEYNIYRSFNDLVGNKTAVYISHRLASTRFCDVIVFFENGEIKEYGTHEELLKKNGSYAEMFNIQAHYYQEGKEKEVI